MKRIQITSDDIDAYIGVLERRERGARSVQHYRRVLEQWYDSLPVDKILTEGALNRWAGALEEKGLAQSTVFNRVSVLRGFLDFLKVPTARYKDVSYERKQQAVQKSVLTRNEYVLLLRAAKEKGSIRTYLFIKTIGGLGIRSTEIQDLTLKHVKDGEIAVTTRGATRTVKIFEPIRSDLLMYAAERGIEEGPVFISKEGQPLQHFFIWKEVKQVCRQMGLPEDKGIPSSLYEMYLETKRNLLVNGVAEVDQNYRALLQEEETIVGWHQSDVQEKAGTEEKESTRFADALVKQDWSPFDKLSREEEDRVIKKLGETLSDILSRKHDCKVKITFTRKEEN